MTSRKPYTVGIKIALYVGVPTAICMYILSYLHVNGNTIAAEKLSEDFSLIHYDVNDTDTFHRFGIPTDYFKRDFIGDNHHVDRLSPKLKTNLEVIAEAQQIHMKMFKALIGKFKYAMLFNFAAFENKGDPAITVGELQLIKKLGIELVFHCATTRCNDDTVQYAKTLSKKYSTDDLVILMHGGGNLLSYLSEDYNRKRVLENFPDFEVILFPQSIWHNANKEETSFLKHVYSKHRHLTFLYRDRNSYNLGKQLFPRVKCFLMPDMAFNIGATKRFMQPTHDILWLRRSDRESNLFKIPETASNYDVIVSDWWEWKTPKGSSWLEDAYLIAANGMLFLQRGRVVITDRLHGHILCVLCGIPHVVIDPVNKKITSYMQSWTGGIENILIAHSAEDALNKASELLRKLDYKITQSLAFPKSEEVP